MTINESPRQRYFLHLEGDSTSYIVQMSLQTVVSIFKILIPFYHECITITMTDFTCKSRFPVYVYIVYVIIIYI